MELFAVGTRVRTVGDRPPIVGVKGKEGVVVKTPESFVAFILVDFGGTIGVIGMLPEEMEIVS